MVSVAIKKHELTLDNIFEHGYVSDVWKIITIGAKSNG